jgi:hypothetical protein
MAESEQTNTSKPGPGSSPVGIVGIVVITIYLAFAVTFCLYGLVVLWPGAPALRQTQPPVEQAASPPSSAVSSPAANKEASPGHVSLNQPTVQSSPSPAAEAMPSQIKIFKWEFPIWDEVRLLLIVILGGALGSLVHALRSVYWYIGHRALRYSWLATYFLLPFGGSALAVIFYVVVRGGFFSPQANIQQTSPFGFAALAAMVGLFSEQAVLKLKEVAETILSKPAPGVDNKPQGEDSSNSPDDTTNP